MVTINVSSVEIGGRSYNKDKSGYPVMPTVFSGVEINFGASSCIEHPEPTSSTLSLWVPKTHENHVPALGESVHVVGGIGSQSSTLFKGSVEDVKLHDDHKPAATPLSTRTNLITNPSAEVNFNGYSAELGTGGAIERSLRSDGGKVGSSYVRTVWTTGNTGGNAGPAYFQSGFSGTTSEKYSVSVWVRSNKTRTVALELTLLNSGVGNTWAGYTPVTLSANVWTQLKIENVTPSAAFNEAYIWAYADAANKFATDDYMDLDGLILEKATTAGTYFDGNTQDTLSAETISVSQWDGVAHASTTTQSVYALNSESGGYRINVVAADAVAAAGRLRIGTTPWDSTILTKRLSDIAQLAQPSGVEFHDPYLGDNLYGVPADRGGDEMLGIIVRARDVDSISALEIYQDTSMSAGITVGSIDNIVGPNYKLLMPRVLDRDVNGVAIIEEVSSKYTERPIPAIPVGAIVDDTFTLDTTETVNQVKLDYFVRKGTAWTSEHLAVSEANMTLSTEANKFAAPVTRGLKTETQVEDPYSSLQPPKMDSANSITIKARGLLAAQSIPRWRLSSGMSLVLKELVDNGGLQDLIEEAGRFGQLIRIDGAPERVESYQRIRAGRIVLGEKPSLDFELEPVDYSAPTVLTRNTAFYDGTTKAITLGAFQNSGITINDLRSIGAR